MFSREWIEGLAFIGIHSRLVMLLERLLVWLTNDNPKLAKKLITEALKAKRDIKIKEAKAKYQKAINALNRIDF